MAILQNARHERVAQNLAKGMSADASHTAAGYKPSRQNAARMSAYDDIRGRVAELMAPARLFRIVKFRARYAEEQRGSDEPARLDKKEHIRARIAELSAPAVEETQATVERVLKALTRLAFYDMTVVLDVADGRRRRGRDL